MIASPPDAYDADLTALHKHIQDVGMESVPVVMMWASKVSRSTMAAQSRGSAKVAVHSDKAALDAMAMEARSFRSVKTWNSSSAPRR
jgi:hypothetical protein